jgi:type VI protein secretion system component Hcp
LLLASIASAGIGGVPVASAENSCDSVTLWEVTTSLNVQFWVRTGEGWVSSVNSDGTAPFGSVSISISGSTLHVVNPYASGYRYTARFTGQLASDCTIGRTTQQGVWSDSKEAHGFFSVRPLGSSCKFARYTMDADGLSFDILSFSDESAFGTVSGAKGLSTMDDLSFTMQTNAASPILFRDLTTARHIPIVTIHAYRPCATTSFLTVTLHDVLVTRYSSGATPGGANPIDSVGLSYAHADAAFAKK